jgi:hypothetical protein
MLSPSLCRSLSLSSTVVAFGTAGMLIIDFHFYSILNL